MLTVGLSVGAYALCCVNDVPMPFSLQSLSWSGVSFVLQAPATALCGGMIPTASRLAYRSTFRSSTVARMSTPLRPVIRVCRSVPVSTIVFAS